MKFLLVDDHPVVLDGLANALQGLAEEVVCDRTTTAEQALQCLQKDHYDLVLIDLVLPGIDGLGLLTSMAERGLLQPAAIIAAEEHLPSIKQALAQGVLGYLPKSLPLHELLAAVHQMLAGHVYLPDELQWLRNAASSRNVATASSVAEHRAITSRQEQVLILMARGFSNKRIALTLNVSEHTVKSHVKALFRTLHVPNRTACVKRAETLGLLQSNIGV